MKRRYRLLATLPAIALLLGGCVPRWAIDSELEAWECAELECKARLYLENPYEARIVFTTFVIAYQEEGVRPDKSTYALGGFEQTASAQDFEVGRTESQHTLEPNASKLVVESVAVSAVPDKMQLIVSEARSIVD